MTPVGQAQLSKRPRSIVVAAVALAVGAGMFAAGCSAGQVSQTADQVAAVNGARGEAGKIAIRDAQFAFPAAKPAEYRVGSSAPLQLTIANTGVEADELVSVESPAAASAEVAGATSIPGGFAISNEDIVATSSAAPTSTSASSSSAAPTSTSASAPGTTTSAAAKPANVAKVRITLTGLKQSINPGLTVPVKFVFRKNGTVTLQVPIAADPKPRAEEPKAEHGEAGKEEH
ncbi:hypothetical protein D5S17_12915 [Pseudonocardiaceae bacterium YIM PH 21723]|nr:hypothetical protein D5S17_12915 [Pseudonocardiaceae bacterium YIM PH 21723]